MPCQPDLCMHEQFADWKQPADKLLWTLSTVARSSAPI